MTRWPSIFLLVAFSCLLLAACSCVPSACTDPLGCLVISPQGSIVIGIILATSGDKGPIGTASLDAVQAAVTDRKLMGHPIRLDRQSTDCTSESAQLAAIELTLDPDLVAVIGPTCETEKQVALPILLDAGIPALSPVPDAGAAGDLLEQLFTCIQQVAVRGSDGSLSIPRQTLLKALNISP